MSERVNELGQPIGFAVPDWKPAGKPPRAPMHGRFVTIVPPDPAAHAPGLFAAFIADRENRIWTYLPYGPFTAVAELQAWMEKTCMGEDPLFHVILDKASGKPVGVASYLRIDANAGVIEVGHINYSPLCSAPRMPPKPCS